MRRRKGKTADRHDRAPCPPTTTHHATTMQASWSSPTSARRWVASTTRPAPSTPSRTRQARAAGSSRPMATLRLGFSHRPANTTWGCTVSVPINRCRCTTRRATDRTTRRATDRTTVPPAVPPTPYHPSTTPKATWRCMHLRSWVRSVSDV